jgi:uncharacterized protein YecE (DUF72 family)
VSTPASTPVLHVGALLDRAPGPKYVATLAFAELGLRAPLPRPATLVQIRARLPEGFALALRAPRDAVVSSQGALRMTRELEASLSWLIAAADACAAQAVLIPTPAELTPGARSRELLRDYVARLPRADGRHYVWLPGGLWEPPESHAVAAELGLVCGFDPLEARRPPGPVAYGTLRALGHRTGFSPSALGDAIDTLLAPGTEIAFLSVDAERAFDVAKRARQIAAERIGAAAAFAADGGELEDEGDDHDEDDQESEGDDWDEDGELEEGTEPGKS